MVDMASLFVILLAAFAFRASDATRLDFNHGFGHYLSCESEMFLGPKEICQGSNECAYDLYCGSGPYPLCQPCEMETACQDAHTEMDDSALQCFNLCPFYYLRQIFAQTRDYRMQEVCDQLIRGLNSSIDDTCPVYDILQNLVADGDDAKRALHMCCDLMHDARTTTLRPTTSPSTPPTTPPTTAAPSSTTPDSDRRDLLFQASFDILKVLTLSRRLVLNVFSCGPDDKHFASMESDKDGYGLTVSVAYTTVGTDICHPCQGCTIAVVVLIIVSITLGMALIYRRRRCC